MALAITTGARFGRLTVVGRSDARQHGHALYECRCDCGGATRALAANLRRGNYKSCGCLRREIAAAKNASHGEAGPGRQTPEYRAWASLIERCTNPRAQAYADYGGRGITVCDRWRQSYEAFLADMGRRPSPIHSIDRKDNDGNYEPENCRWATRIEQRRNQRRKEKK